MRGTAASDDHKERRELKLHLALNQYFHTTNMEVSNPHQVTLLQQSQSFVLYQVNKNRTKWNLFQCQIRL